MKCFRKPYGINNTKNTPVNLLVTNIRYTINNLHFDAAVDINWELHAYSDEYFQEEHWRKNTAIEIYCFDNPDWDIKMIYQTPDTENNMHHTIVDFDNIIEETKKWIKEMSE